MGESKRFRMQITESKHFEEHYFDNPLLMMEKADAEQKAKTMFQRVLLAKGVYPEHFWKEFLVAVYHNSGDGKKELLLEYEESKGRKELRLYNIALLSEISREIAASSGYELKPLF